MPSFFRCIKSDCVDSIPIHYFFYTAEELKEIQAAYQQRFYGHDDDLLLLCENDLGDCYYAVFRSIPCEVSGSPSSLLSFKDNNRLLIVVGSAIYHYFINSCECNLVNTLYHFEEARYMSSITSSEDEIIIIANDRGISALDWTQVLWQIPFEYAYAGYLTFQYIKDHILFVDYFEPGSGDLLL